MNWISPLTATIVLMLASVAIASLVGILTTWAMEISRCSGPITRRLIAPLCLLACATAVISPMILHAAAWEATAGKFGITMLTQTGTRVTSGDRYSLFAGGLATSWIHGIHGAGIITLATLLGIRRTPKLLKDPARMRLGRNAIFWKVDLPMASPWWGSGMVIIAMLAATEMTVADLYGFRTIADQFYLYYAADPNWPSVFTVCFLPLALAAMLIVWFFVSRRRVIRLPAHRHSQRDDTKDVTAEALSLMSGLASALVMMVVILLLAAVPIFGMVNKLGQSVISVGENLQVQWQLDVAVSRLLQAPHWFSSEYQWTATIGLTSGLAAILMAWPIASLSHRHRIGRMFVDILSVLLICIPGPVVGLVVFGIFQKEIPGFRFLMQQTIFPTVIACLVRAVPLAYWILRAGYASISAEVLDAATMRVGPMQRLWLIERPLMLRWVAVAFVVASVFASGDLPATQPLIPAGISTVPVRLFGLLHSGARYQEAALAFWYLAGMILVTYGVIKCVTAGQRVDS